MTFRPSDDVSDEKLVNQQTFFDQNNISNQKSGQNMFGDHGSNGDDSAANNGEINQAIMNISTEEVKAPDISELLKNSGWDDSLKEESENKTMMEDSLSINDQQNIVEEPQTSNNLQIEGLSMVNGDNVLGKDMKEKGENIKNSSVFIPIDTVTKRFGKEIEKFNKALEPKPSNAIDVLIIDPFESPNYEEIIENIKNSSVFIPIDTVTKRFGKEIEKFNKALEPKPQKILDINSTIDETPWYDIFLKKGNKHIYKSSKPNSKKKGNKRK